MTIKPILSIVIVAYKDEKILSSCLNSIKKYNDIGVLLEVVVVDNTPGGRVADLLGPIFSDVLFLKNSRNGFGIANNIGARKSKGEYLLFLNPDTIFIEPVLNFAVKKFESDKTLALFGVKLLDLSLKNNISFYIIDGHGFFTAQIIKACNKLNIYVDGLMYTSGADMFIRKEVFLSCGMFDENIFMYYEEPDLTKRVRRLGFKTAFFPSKRIIHLEGKCTKNSFFALSERLKSLIYYCDKYQLDLNSRIKKEITYAWIKFLCYYFLNDQRADICKTQINTLKEFLKSR